MKNSKWLWSVPMLAVVLSGCGSPPRQAPSAKKDIEEAQMAMDGSRMNERRLQYDAAIGDMRRAREAISKGKGYAEDTDLSKLNSMDDEVRKRLMELETKKMTYVPEPEKLKAVTAVKSEDPEEKKKREADALESKRMALAAKDKAALDATFKVQEKSTAKAQPKDDDDVVAEKPAAKKDKAVDGEEPAEGETPKPKKAAVGPYPEQNETSEPLQVVKLTKRGQFAIAYFQIFNKGSAGKRIGNIGVIFKNANGQEIINPLSVATFQYSGFKPDIADPTQQSTAAAVTAGSHQITGNESIQLVAVGDHSKAPDVKSVGVIVVFDDGTRLSSSGPKDGAVDVVAPVVKGLKLK